MAEIKTIKPIEEEQWTRVGKRIGRIENSLLEENNLSRMPPLLPLLLGASNEGSTRMSVCVTNPRLQAAGKMVRVGSDCTVEL